MILLCVFLNIRYIKNVLNNINTYSKLTIRNLNYPYYSHLCQVRCVYFVRKAAMRKSDKIIYAPRPIMVVTDRQTDPPKSNLLEENYLTKSVINGSGLRSSGKKRKPPEDGSCKFLRKTNNSLLSCTVSQLSKLVS